ncbi:hypothetical protein ISCGN_024019 [Ixodes scapularis]
MRSVLKRGGVVRERANGSCLRPPFLHFLLRARRRSPSTALVAYEAVIFRCCPPKSHHSVPNHPRERRPGRYPPGRSDLHRSGERRPHCEDPCLRERTTLGRELRPARR